MERLIEKRTGTYTETLEAVGLASLLRELRFIGVAIKDEGTHFCVRSATDVARAAWSDLVSPGYPYIWERSKESRPALEDVIDYEGEKEKRKASKKVGKKSKAALELHEIEAGMEPVPGINTATILASMRKG